MKLSIFRIVGAVLLTFVVVWALVLGWWQANDHEPGRQDLVLYLLAIPVALNVGFWLLYGFIGNLTSPESHPGEKTPLATGDDPLGGLGAPPEDTGKTHAIGLVDAFVAIPNASDGDGLLSAVKKGIRPGPSDEFTDADGYPVVVAKVDGVDVSVMATRLIDAPASVSEWVAAHPLALRWLTLLDGVLGKAHDAIESLLTTMAAMEAVRLRVVWLVPVNANSALLGDLGVWLRRAYWKDLSEGELSVSIHAATGEAEALKRLDDNVLRIGGDGGGNEVTVLLAASSSIDASVIEERLAGNRLFSSGSPDRQIPGEGSVALILASRSVVERAGLADVIWLGRPCCGAVGKAPGSGGRITGTVLRQLVTSVLENASADPVAVKTAVLDTDHRPSYIAEAMEGLGEAFGHLDPIQDCLSLSAVVGSPGLIGGLLTVACARARVLQDQTPVLCICNQDEFFRAALLASPMSAPLPMNQPST